MCIYIYKYIHMKMNICTYIYIERELYKDIHNSVRERQQSKSNSSCLILHMTEPGYECSVMLFGVLL